MQFDELEARLRQYETNSDKIFLPDIDLVVRLDGRNFTNLTAAQNFEKPFDERFRDMMVATTEYLMSQTGFKVVYGYTCSDEISLLLDNSSVPFERKERKINSILAGEASSYFSLQLGKVAVFDARVCQLPRRQLIVDYFRWRSEDATRNALNGWCYWTLRQKRGLAAKEASETLAGQTLAYKNELLFKEAGLNFNNDVPNWQKRGVGLYWRKVEKSGYNPLSQQPTVTLRNNLYKEFNLPMKEAYDRFILEVLEGFSPTVLQPC